MGLGLAHVGHNLAQRPLLRRGGMKRQHLADRLAHLVGGGKADARRAPSCAGASVPAPVPERTAPRRSAAGGPGWTQLCNWAKGVPSGGKCTSRSAVSRSGRVEPLQHRARQALRHRAAHAFQQIEDRLALPARGQPRAAQRLVNRRDAAHFEQPRLGVVASRRAAPRTAAGSS